MTDELPLVTIITPAYNRADFIDETIQSVLMQKYPNIEYIVLDDGSTDNTLEVLEKYQGKLFMESHANMGETRTVNKGIGMARGEIICIVNSDDPILSGLVSTAVEYLKEYPDALAVYPDWREIGPHSELIKELKLPQYDLITMLTGFNVAMGPGTFIRRRAFQLAGLRDTQFRYAGDLEFWFRLATHGPIIHIPEVLATHRSHPDSASVSERGAKMAGELIQMVRKVYSFPNLPPDVIEKRREVFGLAHHEAFYYCGNNAKVALKHYLMAVLYDPYLFSVRKSKAVIKYLLLSGSRSKLLREFAGN
jgi:glycosyltransferase involved in cell wall biosynthesis